MNSSGKTSSRSSFRALPSAARAYVALIGVLGWAGLAYSGYQVATGSYAALPILIGLTVITSCLGIKVPLPSGLAGGFALTVSDCFVFMGLLLYGPAAAVCLGAVDGIVGSLRFRIRTPYRIQFNVAGIALVAFVVSHAFKLVFAALPQGRPFMLSVGLLAAVGFSALLYFTFSSLVVAVAMALTSKQPVGQVWSRYFPWASPATVMNAAAALVFLMSLDFDPNAQAVAIAFGIVLLAGSTCYALWGRWRLLSRTQSPLSGFEPQEASGS